MDEKEYKRIYNAINQLHCVFEKSILARKCACSNANKFHLADREGVSCNSARAQALCQELLHHMRKNAVFALKLKALSGPLPHAKEIKVQAGGMLGLQQALHPEDTEADKVGNVTEVISGALEKYGSMDTLPYQEIVKSIVAFQGRRKRTPRG